MVTVLLISILLKSFTRNTLIITGTSINICVYATALDAIQIDMHTIDGVVGTSVELHKAVLDNIDYCFTLRS